jgi:hypothetical protein
MNKHPRKPGDNVVPLPMKPRGGRNSAREFADDPAGSAAAATIRVPRKPCS